MDVRNTTEAELKPLGEILMPLIVQLESLSGDPIKDALVNHASKIVADELILTLRAMTNKYSTALPTITILKPLCEHVDQYWRDIKKTASNYFRNPYSLANQSYFLIATFLSGYVKIDAWTLLMPSVPSISRLKEASESEDFHLHQFILGDNERLINVRDCLENAAKKKSTTLIYANVVLSEYEKEQVIHHSQAAKELYSAIQTHAVKKDERRVDLALDAFLKKIRSKDYEVNLPKRIKIESDKQLSSFVFTRQEKLMDIANILIFTEKQQWITLLNTIADEDLLRVGLENKLLTEAVKTINCDDSMCVKAALFCLAEIYWRNRDKQDKYTSSFGWLSDYTYRTVGGYSKDEKEAGVILFQTFLLDDDYQLTELDRYLNEFDIEKVKTFIAARLSNLEKTKDQDKHVEDIVQLITKEKQKIVAAMYEGTFNALIEKLNSTKEENKVTSAPYSLYQLLPFQRP